MSKQVEILSQPLKLACGLVLPNRLVKAAMAEGLAQQDDHTPSIGLRKAYKEWGNGGWGCILTGNVHVDVRHLNKAGDVGVTYTPSDRQKLLDTWKEWAAVSQSNGTPALMQINHPGRQAPAGAGTRSYWDKTIAPSAIPLDLGPGIIAKAIRLYMFGTPQEMSLAQIDQVIDQFATAAKLAAESGFQGVEVHAAHGYLLSQFSSPKSNKRTDAFGGNARKRVEIVLRIIKKIRAETPPTFCVGVKLNSADHDSELDDVLEQIKVITEAGIDFLEISGGTYENPTMMTKNESSQPAQRTTNSREAFFLEFATKVRKVFPTLTILLTGGFRSRSGMANALSSGACDLIGVGRPAAVNPAFCKDAILNVDVRDSEAVLPLPKAKLGGIQGWLNIRALSGGAETRFYRDNIKQISLGKKTTIPEE